jgi:plastocyanin
MITSRLALAGMLSVAMFPGWLLVSRNALSALPSDAIVTIDNFWFTPAEITVAVGTKVTWTNHDDIPHTVTDAADDKKFKSPALDTGDEFSHVFDKSGTYHYFCALHPHMQGAVTAR